MVYNWYIIGIPRLDLAKTDMGGCRRAYLVHLTNQPINQSLVQTLDTGTYTDTNTDTNKDTDTATDVAEHLRICSL